MASHERADPMTVGRPIQVVGQVRPEDAAALHGTGPATPGTLDLRRRAQALHVDVRPLDPAGAESVMGQYFVVEVGDWDTAQRIAADLRESEAVVAAYAKPPDETP
jgi:hypothetical protein